MRRDNGCSSGAAIASLSNLFILKYGKHTFSLSGKRAAYRKTLDGEYQEVVTGDGR